MPEATIVQKGLRCSQCGHRWLPRSVKPTICPKCKRTSWNERNRNGNKGK